MTEIRTITEAEAPSFLELLCEVFDLDFGRAKSIFFAEPLFDLNRKWALFKDGQITSILTTVPLEFGWGRAVGIAGVATSISRQRQGFAADLLSHVVDHSERTGEGGVLLFAADTRLYAQLGFEVLDQVVRGPIEARPEVHVPMSLEFGQIRDRYDAWALGHPSRLRRDALRWNYWRWNLRVCTPFHDGYLCFEGGIVREIVINSRAFDWELPLETEWLGLASMAQSLGVEMSKSTIELQFMGYRVPSIPQMFMTDQF